MAITACSWLGTTHLTLNTYLAVFLDVLRILIFGKQEIEHDGAVSVSLFPVTKAPTSRKHLRCLTSFCSSLIWCLSEVADCLQPGDTPRQLACLQLPRLGLAGWSSDTAFSPPPLLLVLINTKPQHLTLIWGKWDMRIECFCCQAKHY